MNHSAYLCIVAAALDSYCLLAVLVWRAAQPRRLQQRIMCFIPPQTFVKRITLGSDPITRCYRELFWKWSLRAYREKNTQWSITQSQLSCSPSETCLTLWRAEEEVGNLPRCGGGKERLPGLVFNEGTLLSRPHAVHVSAWGSCVGQWGWGWGAARKAEAQRERDRKMIHQNVLGYLHTLTCFQSCIRSLGSIWFDPTT